MPILSDMADGAAKRIQREMVKAFGTLTTRQKLLAAKQVFGYVKNWMEQLESEVAKGL